MPLEMAHTDGKVIHTWPFLCHRFLIWVKQNIMRQLINIAGIQEIYSAAVDVEMYWRYMICGVFSCKAIAG